jgi:hypothetical protein
MSAGTGRAALPTTLMLDNIVSVPWSMNACQETTLLGSPALVISYCLYAKLLSHINLSHTQSKNMKSTSAPGSITMTYYYYVKPTAIGEIMLRPRVQN